jgi:PIN domain nuclease of toxin-antitoxin system
LKLLLDTHVVFWWLLDPDKLSRPAMRAIETIDEVFVSAASSWEMATKVRLGNWAAAATLVARLPEELASESFASLAISHHHARHAGLLVADRRDPFDRILAAQAALEGLVLVTADSVFDSMSVERLW